MFKIVAYNPAWPARFQAYAQPIADALGETALAIHHIGSTSVPGLDAKDCIDIQLSVAAFDRSYEKDLVDLGFVPRDFTSDHAPWGMQVDPSEMEKRYFSDPVRCIHLHLRIPGRLNHRYAILCRDYLRTHPIAASAYAEIKHQLVKRFADDEDSYYDIKNPVFDVIMSGAFDWAQSSGWVVPAGDIAV